MDNLALFIGLVANLIAICVALRRWLARPSPGHDGVEWRRVDSNEAESTVTTSKKETPAFPSQRNAQRRRFGFDVVPTVLGIAMILGSILISPISPLDGRCTNWILPLVFSAFGLFSVFTFAPYPIPSDAIKQLLQRAKRSYHGTYKIGITFDASTLPPSTIEKIKRHLPPSEDDQLGEVDFKTRDGRIIYQVSARGVQIRCNDDVEDTESLIRSIVEHIKASRRLA